MAKKKAIDVHQENDALYNRLMDKMGNICSKYNRKFNE